MSPAKRRMSSILIFSAILLIAVGISAGLYFFKIQKNEDYQNQLHFRELNVAAHSFRSSLEQFKSVGSTVLVSKNRIEELKNKKEVESKDKDLKKAKDALEQYQARTRASESLRHIELVPSSQDILPNLIDKHANISGLHVLEDGYSYFVHESIQKNWQKDSVTMVKAPTKDFLPSTLLSFPLVMIADVEGVVLVRKEYYENSTNAADLQFKTVKALLEALEKQQRTAINITDLESKQGVTYSGTIELMVSSIAYRIFIQPVSITERAGTVSTYFVLGLVPLSDMQLDKLSVSSSTGLWILIALLTLSAAIPILKIRFFPSKHLYRPTDISLFFAGTILLLGIIGITLNHSMFYSYLINTKYLQAESIFNAINEDFKEEVRQINWLAQHKLLIINPLENSQHDKKYKEHCESLVVNKNVMDSSTGSKVKSYNCVSQQLYFPFKDVLGRGAWSFVEGVFRLNYQGVIVRRDTDWNNGNTKGIDLYREPIIRISSAANNFSDFHLGHREYFQRALSCNLWFTDTANREDCRKGFFIQRIKNVSDARLSTQFSYADFENTEVDISEREVKSVSVKLRSFFARILPENFGYAVFNHEGLVLYHSDESRVLLENILVDTYGNENIQTLMRNKSQIYSKNDKSMPPVRFQGDYRDAQSLFVGGTLSDTVPWNLVVFYKTEGMARSSLWMVIFSVTLSFSLLILVFIWNRFGTKQYFWSKLLSFSPEHADQYGRFALLLIGAIVFCLFSMGILVDLYGRISLWFVVLCGLVSWLSFKLDVIPLIRNTWAHPSFPFAFQFAIFLLLFIRYSNMDGFSFDLADILFFVGGLLFFAMTVYFSCFNTSTKVNFIFKTRLTSWFSQHFPKFIPDRVRPLRYGKGYVVYIATLLWLFSIVPASMFINATNHFLLDYRAYNQTRSFATAFQANQTAMESYLRILKAPNKPNSQNEVNDYLKEFDPHEIIYDRTKIDDWGTEKKRQDQLFCRLLFSSCDTVISTNDYKQRFNWISIKPIQAYVDPMLNSLASDQSIGGAIHKGFYHFAQAQNSVQQTGRFDKIPAKQANYVNYNGNQFMLNALSDSWLSILVATVLLFWITFLFTKRYIVHRIMGEHLPDNFRTFEPTYTNLCFEQIEKIAGSGRRVRVQLIRSPNATAVDSLNSCLGGKAVKGRLLSIQELLLQSDAEMANFISSLRSHSGKGDFIALNGLECVAFNPTMRIEALHLLEKIDREEHLSIILVCDIAPLFRLCKPHAYPGVDPKCYAKIDEVVAWTNLLFKYEKLYNWNPSSKKRLRRNATLQDVLDHEGKGWPALGNIKSLFEVQAKKHAIDKWKPDQIIEFFASHAGAIYRDKWEVCTTDERFTLFQLANGASINPSNLETLEQLVKRGYIYRDCGWFIVNESFRRFILFAELESTYAQWMDDTNSTTWQFVRVPILVAILVLAGMVIIGTGQSLQSVLATATATLGVVPLLLRNLSFFRSTSPITAD